MWEANFTLKYHRRGARVSAKPVNYVMPVVQSIWRRIKSYYVSSTPHILDRTLSKRLLYVAFRGHVLHGASYTNSVKPRIVKTTQASVE